MKKIDKGLTTPTLVLINCPKISQMPQNFSVQIVCPSPKVLGFDEKRLHWASEVHVCEHHLQAICEKVLSSRCSLISFHTAYSSL